MSSQRGNTSKRGPPKYKNTTAFKNDLHGANSKTKMLNELAIEGCCRRCRDILEWKIKYNKYKTLTQPKKCVKCLQKRVNNAYYTICKICAEPNHLCGKCGEDTRDPKDPPGDGLPEEVQKDAEPVNSDGENDDISEHSENSTDSDF